VLTVVLQAFIWTLFTRLETRTKESNCCASVRDCNPRREMKVKASLLAEVSRYVSYLQHRPALSFVQGPRKSITVRTRKMVSYTCAG
jgi:hypothetical protein